MSSWQQLNNKSKNPKFDAFAMDDKRRSKRTGTSVYNGACNLKNWLDQWQSGKLGTGSRV